MDTTKKWLCHICSRFYERKFERRHQNSTKHWKAAAGKRNATLCQDCGCPYHVNFLEDHLISNAHNYNE